MEPKVRFIIQSYSTACDRNGNTSHHSIITSTKTGKRLQIKDAGGPTNARALVYDVFKVYEYPTVYMIEDSCSHERMKWLNKSGFFEHDVRIDLDLIRDLEVEDLGA